MQSCNVNATRDYSGRALRQLILCGGCVCSVLFNLAGKLKINTFTAAKRKRIRKHFHFRFHFQHHTIARIDCVDASIHMSSPHLPPSNYMHAIGYVTCDTHCTMYMFSRCNKISYRLFHSGSSSVFADVCPSTTSHEIMEKADLRGSKISRTTNLVLRTNHFWKTELKVFMVCDPRLLHFVFNSLS